MLEITKIMSKHLHRFKIDDTKLKEKEHYLIILQNLT